MGKMFCVMGSVQRTRPDGYVQISETPTFYLSANMQGILDEEHACRVAFHVIAPNRIPASSETVKNTYANPVATITTQTTDGETVIISAMAVLL